MKIAFEIDKFILSDIDYELIQMILRGLNTERRNLTDKINTLSACIYKNYPTEQIEQFKIQLAYVKDKQKELIKMIEYCHNQIEDMPI
jgi:hypothetical protein